MSTKKIVAATAALAMLGVSAHADTGIRSSSSTSIRIRAFVPVICHVQLAANVSRPDEDGVATLGTANEFCNAPRGYRVIVQHPANLEGAALIKEGQRVPLSPTGQTILTDSAHADIRRVALAVDMGDEPAQFRSLAIRIEAKG